VSAEQKNQSEHTQTQEATEPHAPSDDGVRTLDCYVKIGRTFALDGETIAALRKRDALAELEPEQATLILQTISKALEGNPRFSVFLKRVPWPLRSLAPILVRFITRINSLMNDCPEKIDRRAAQDMVARAPFIIAVDGEWFHALLKAAARLIPDPAQRGGFLCDFPAYFGLNPISVTEFIRQSMPETRDALGLRQELRAACDMPEPDELDLMLDPAEILPLPPQKLSAPEVRTGWPKGRSPESAPAPAGDVIPLLAPRTANQPSEPTEPEPVAEPPADEVPADDASPAPEPLSADRPSESAENEPQEPAHPDPGGPLPASGPEPNEAEAARTPAYETSNARLTVADHVLPPSEPPTPPLARQTAEQMPDLKVWTWKTTSAFILAGWTRTEANAHLFYFPRVDEIDPDILLASLLMLKKYFGWRGAAFTNLLRGRLHAFVLYRDTILSRNYETGGRLASAEFLFVNEIDRRVQSLAASIHRIADPAYAPDPESLACDVIKEMAMELKRWQLDPADIFTQAPELLADQCRPIRIAWSLALRFDLSGKRVASNIVEHRAILFEEDLARILESFNLRNRIITAHVPYPEAAGTLTPNARWSRCYFPPELLARRLSAIMCAGIVKPRHVKTSPQDAAMIASALYAPANSLFTERLTRLALKNRKHAPKKRTPGSSGANAKKE
jgi:hypothetical protein